MVCRSVDHPDAGSFVRLVPGDNCSDKALAVGATCRVHVYFIPQAPAGEKNADLVAKTATPADGTAKAALKVTATGGP
jgi:hypothetical protein